MAHSLQDVQVQATNDDASSSKCSAVQMGYWTDEYISCFTKPCSRKPPEMNRGYYARVKAIESIVKQFLQKTESKCQVVNLGAGSDTSFWNLEDSSLMPLCWVDVDFETIIAHKIKTIRLKKVLFEKLKIPIMDTDKLIKRELHSSVYHCVPCDLRDLSDLENTLKTKCGVNPSLPTLFITECVMVYMDASQSTALVNWVAQNFANALFVNYEQVEMGDRFGDVMLENLKSRGCGLVGVKHCISMQSQLDRFLKNGWSGAHGSDMLQIYHGLPPQELTRIERIEFLDEMEVFEMLLKHYCVIIAHTSKPPLDLSTITLSVNK